MAQTDDPRARLVAARRAQILDAAIALFADKGFAATTIRDIARAAGVADGTVYLYFENKSALLVGILDRMRESLTGGSDLVGLDRDDPRDFLRAYLRLPLATPRADDFALFRVILSEIMVNDAMRERYSQQILRPNADAAEGALGGWAERHDLRGLDAELTTRLLAALVIGLIVARIAGDEVLTARWEELPDLLATLLVDGLVGKPGGGG